MCSWTHPTNYIFKVLLNFSTVFYRKSINMILEFSLFYRKSINMISELGFEARPIEVC